jgi:hypothetical protein
MKKIITAVFCVGVGAIGLTGCTSTQVGTTTGAAAGAGLGYAVSGGNAVGTVIGAGTGALIGNAIGQRRIQLVNATLLPLIYVKNFNRTFVV